MPFCIFCGTKNDEGVTSCTVCNSPLHQVTATVPPNAPSAPPIQEVVTVPPIPEAPPIPIPEAPLASPQAQVTQAYVPPAPAYTPPPPVYTPPIAPTPTAPKEATSSKRTQYIDEAPPAGSRYSVLGSANIWFSIFFMHIPIIGWITCLVWAFSKKGNINRRNLARATLVSILIQIASWYMAYCAIVSMVDMATTAIQGIIDSVPSSIASELENIGGIASIGGIDNISGILEQIITLIP